MSSIGVFTGKCGFCSSTLKKKKHFACSECSQFLCKDHYRLHPNTCITYCIKCFEHALSDEVKKENESKIKSLKSSLFKTKEKIKLIKKEKTEKNAVAERLAKQFSSNEKIFADKLSAEQNKIDRLTDNEQTKKLAAQNLQVSIQDLIIDLKSEKEKLKKVNLEYNEHLKGLERLNQDNAKLREQIGEIHKEIKNRVPYERLRNLACEECKSKIKKRFRNEILAANANHNSIVDSVMAQKISVRKSTVPVLKNIKEKESCCDII